jgi:hypothetical protein
MDKHINQLIELESEAADAARVVEGEIKHLKLRAGDSVAKKLEDISRRTDAHMRDIRAAARHDEARRVAAIRDKYAALMETLAAQHAAESEIMRAELVNRVLYGT